MEFCPNCGAMLLPEKSNLKCGCGYSKNLSESNSDQYEVSEKVKEKDTVIMKGEDINLLPTTNEVCPECGYDKAAYELRQTRSADEAETRFFQCLKCKHKWREYD